MLTKERLNILKVFQKENNLGLTYNQIKEKSRQKSNSVTQEALKEFKRERLIKTEIVGDIAVYYLNLDNNLTLSYLNQINEQELLKRKLPKDILGGIQKRILKYTEFFILIIFGSYAKNKATEKSDVDIALIVETEQTKKEVVPFLETIKRRQIREIDYHVFTRNEFIEMLKTDNENLGKQICKHGLVYYGYTEYINLIRGVRNER